jgi:hypothetical protein
MVHIFIIYINVVMNCREGHEAIVVRLVISLTTYI